MNVIALVGAGQLGSRHLQSLAQLDEIDIQVVDPDPAALELARQRFEEVAKEFKGSVSYYTSLNQLNDDLDIVIVATGSRVRKNIISELLATRQIKYLILEKFLFPRLKEYEDVSDMLSRTKTKVWVNCPRRIIDFYRNLKNNLEGRIQMSVTGNNWGLGCNGIHMLDLFALLTGSAEVTLSGKLLDKEIIPSRRPGYIEFTGTITCTSGYSALSLTSFSKGESPAVIFIADENNRLVIREGQPSSVWHSAINNDWKWEITEFNFPFQSQLTHIAVNDLILTGTCGLTPYNESSLLHFSFLQNLIDHLKITDPHVTECLIT